VSGFVIDLEDPGVDDIRALLEQHLALMYELSPPEDVHALDLDGLRTSDISFYSLREDGTLLAIGALKQLDGEHAEVKSMHTTQAARGRGLGRAMLDHLLAEARRRGVRRVSLETGSQDGFAPARGLYTSAGFDLTRPFADYRESPSSTFMTLELERAQVSA
jgi:putative acetyltransferase